MRPNQSIEPTATGKPVSAAHVKRSGGREEIMAAAERTADLWVEKVAPDRASHPKRYLP